MERSHDGKKNTNPDEPVGRKPNSIAFIIVKYLVVIMMMTLIALMTLVSPSVGVFNRVDGAYTQSEMSYSNDDSDVASTRNNAQYGYAPLWANFIDYMMSNNNDNRLSRWYVNTFHTETNGYGPTRIGFGFISFYVYKDYGNEECSSD